MLELRPFDPKHDVAVHLNEAAIRVPCESRISGPQSEPLDGLWIEPEVEHGVHHPRHRHCRARAYREQQWLGRRTEVASSRLLDHGDGVVDFAVESIGEALGCTGTVLLGDIRVVGADLGRKRESSRHRDAEVGHLREVGALAAQEIALAGAAGCLTVRKGVDVWRSPCDFVHCFSCRGCRLRTFHSVPARTNAMSWRSSPTSSKVLMTAVTVPVRASCLSTDVSGLT